MVTYKNVRYMRDIAPIIAGVCPTGIRDDVYDAIESMYSSPRVIYPQMVYTVKVNSCVKRTVSDKGSVSASCKASLVADVPKSVLDKLGISTDEPLYTEPTVTIVNDDGSESEIVGIQHSLYNAVREVIGRLETDYPDLYKKGNIGALLYVENMFRDYLNTIEVAKYSLKHFGDGEGETRFNFQAIALIGAALARHDEILAKAGSVHLIEAPKKS